MHFLKVNQETSNQANEARSTCESHEL